MTSFAWTLFAETWAVLLAVVIYALVHSRKHYDAEYGGTIIEVPKPQSKPKKHSCKPPDQGDKSLIFGNPASVGMRWRCNCGETWLYGKDSYGVVYDWHRDSDRKPNEGSA